MGEDHVTGGGLAQDRHRLVGHGCLRGDVGLHPQRTVHGSTVRVVDQVLGNEGVERALQVAAVVALVEVAGDGLAFFGVAHLFLLDVEADRSRFAAG